MSLRKVGLLASLALALVAFAIPASASAITTITHEGAIYKGEVEFGLGNAKFELLGTGIECEEVTAKISQNGNDEQDVTEFHIFNPTTKCKFFGVVYGGCEFEEHPVAKSLPWGLDILDNTDSATITNSTVTNNPGTINAELKAQAGKTCNITTNDITVVHEVNTNVTAEIETDANKFITGIILKGKVKVDSAGAAAGTTTTGHSSSVATVSGTLKVEKANTFKLN